MNWYRSVKLSGEWWATNPAIQKDVTTLNKLLQRFDNLYRSWRADGNPQNTDLTAKQLTQLKGQINVLRSRIRNWCVTVGPERPAANQLTPQRPPQTAVPA
jgi:hypothetical protein